MTDETTATTPVVDQPVEPTTPVEPVATETPVEPQA